MRVWGNFGCNSHYFWFKWFTLEIETFFYLVRHCGYCFLPLLEGQEARLAPHHSHWLYGSKRSKSFQILGTGISHLGLDPDRRYFGVFNHTHLSKSCVNQFLRILWWLLYCNLVQTAEFMCHWSLTLTIKEWANFRCHSRQV